MNRPAPLWKMPTREQAKETLVYSRSTVEELIAGLNQNQMTRPTLLGGGGWSIKDLLGHLAGYEEQAVAIASGRTPPLDFSKFGSVDERNAADVDRKRDWSLDRIRGELGKRRSELLQTIDEMDDEKWAGKIQTGSGRSALALVLGKLLVGGHYGFFAHDLAHITDLKKSVKILKASEE